MTEVSLNTLNRQMLVNFRRYASLSHAQSLRPTQISPPSDLRIAVGGVPNQQAKLWSCLPRGTRREGANRTACAVTASLHPNHTTKNPRAKIDSAASISESKAWMLLAAPRTCLIQEEICAHSQNRSRCLIER